MHILKILKIYWFYQVIKNIKNNNIQLVEALVEKHFQDTFNNYFFKLSYSYSYDCFDYFYRRLKIKKGGHYFLPYYRQILLKQDNNYLELEKIFHYDFGVVDESHVQNFHSDYEIDRLRYQIVSNLIKQNKFDTIGDLIKNITQRSKNSIFKYYLQNYIIFNEEQIKKLITILQIEQAFFEKDILDCYFPSLDKMLYLFLKNNYEINRQYYISCFLRTSNYDLITQIDNDFNITLNDKIQKMHTALFNNYKYKDSADTLDIINLYQSLNYLNEDNILHSYKQQTHEIIIDFTYLPLLKLSPQAEIEMLKKNLVIIIFHKDYYYDLKDKDNINKTINKLECYFDFIKEKIDINKDSLFIEDLLQFIFTHSNDVFLYFYKKFPDIFVKKACNIFTNYFNQVTPSDFIVNEILLEKEKTRKEVLIQTCLNAFIAITHHHEPHNATYFLLKNFINNNNKEKILYSKSKFISALPIIKDILQEQCFNNSEVIYEVFIKSVCDCSKNAIYILENYNLDSNILVKGFVKLNDYEYNEINQLLAKKILEKNIELDNYDQYLIKEKNIDLYKLYISYSLNRKLENKYIIKNIREKKLKI